MDMNKAFTLKESQVESNWRVIDARGQTLGRLATQVATILRGKDKVTYTPHMESGDYVVIINAEKAFLSGNKLNDKVYRHHSGWIGGMKEVLAKDLLKKKPTRLVELAVKGMLPKGPLGRKMFKKLRIYADASHPHVAQVA